MASDVMTPDLDFLARIVRRTAATEIMPRFCQTTAGQKPDGSLITEADLAVQARLTEALADAFPNIPLLGEEMTGEEQARLLAESGDGLWVLDPLDGTTNYANGFPGFGIALALLERGRPVMGVVLDPVRDECFTAARGAGAFLNGVRMRSGANGSELCDCIAMIDLKRVPRNAIPALFRSGGFGSQRNLGSVALEWCWLGAGRFQLYLHGGQKLWDYAAGRLIAEESGAAAQHYRRDDLRPIENPGLESRLAVAAANDDLMRRWLDFLTPVLTLS